MRIRILKDGPVLIETSGKFKVKVGEKEEIREGKVVALCRCGRSNDKPFCDGSHARAGFRAEGVEIEVE